MNILFVSAVLPYPLHSGGQVRIYNLLKRLSQKHDITLYAFIRDDKENQYIKELSFCKKVVTVMRGRAWQARYFIQSMVTSFPFLYATYNNGQMRDRLLGELRLGYDLIHLEPGYVWASLPRTTKPVVVSEHNIEHEVYQKFVDHFRVFFLRPMMRRDVAKMDAWERRIWKAAAHVTAASDDDRDHMRGVVDENKITVVKNGVDTEQFSFHPKKTISSSRPIFLYVGAFRWIQNIDAARHMLQHLWPLIRTRYPKAVLRIVGKHPPDQLKNLADGRVSFLEFVEDIHKEYVRADILLAPIRVGGGTKYKIIESMASGLPVVTTNVGAQGIDTGRGDVMWIAQNDEEMVARVHDIIQLHPERKKRLANARKLVEAGYSWTHIADELGRVWEKIYEKTTSED